MRLARSVSMLTGVAVATAALAAQEGRQRPGGGTQLIVRAVANGVPVADLKAEEITIRVDGRAREVKNLELVNTAVAPSAPELAKATAVSTLPPPFDTNAAAAPAPSGPSRGREFVIMLDEDGIAAGQEEPVRKAVAKLMSEATETDRFGLISLRLGGKQIPPSGSRAAITEQFGKLVGGGLTTENTVDFACRTKRTMGALANAMETSPPGRTLVLITSGLAANPAGVNQIRSRVDAQGNFDNTIPETCQIRTNDLENFGATAALSPANMYIVHFPQGMPAQDNQQAGQTGIENLAGVSNAEMVRLTGGNEPSLSRVVKETSSYYIATLDEGPAGGIRRIDARVNREGVKVIARPATGHSRGPAAATESSKGKSPRDMIATAAKFTDVPLRAAAFISRQGATDMKVVTLFEPVAPGVKLTAASVAVISEQDPSKASQVNLKPEELQRTPIAVSLLVKPGRYRVRVAATTAEGGGTVDSTLAAEYQSAGALKASSMLVGVSGERGFVPRLQFTPEDKMAVAVLELYDVPAGANVTTQFEITESESAQPLGTAPGNMQKGATEDSRTVFGGFGTETLQPGDYLMRIRISLDGKEVGIVSRTFRKTSG